jgi:hypothetical protein
LAIYGQQQKEKKKKQTKGCMSVLAEGKGHLVKKITDYH